MMSHVAKVRVDRFVEAPHRPRVQRKRGTCCKGIGNGGMTAASMLRCPFSASASARKSVVVRP